jgi:hypothetical protein
MGNPQDSINVLPNSRMTHTGIVAQFTFQFFPTNNKMPYTPPIFTRQTLLCTARSPAPDPPPRFDHSEIAVGTYGHLERSISTPFIYKDCEEPNDLF